MVVRNDMESFALVTRQGNQVQVNPGGRSCSILIDGRKENPRMVAGMKTSDQPISRIIFVGPDLEPGTEEEGVQLFPNRKFRLHIPFRYLPTHTMQQLTLRCNSVSDQFPADIRQVERMDELPELLQKGNPFQYVVLAPGFKKMDLIKLKVYFSSTKVLLVKPPETESESENQSPAVVRATDMVRNQELSQLSGDPVFLARIHLRNLDLDATRQLLLDFNLNGEEIQFIRTFFHIMIRNERNDKDLLAARKELENLDELFRLGQILLKEDRTAFDHELERGMNPRVAEYLIPVVSKIRKTTDKKEDEIYFWECEFRLSRMKSEDSA